MNLGVFGKTYERPTVAAVFAACVADGLPLVQFNFTSAGLPPMPAAIDPDMVASIRQAADDAGATIVSISSTFNMIHPDPSVRAEGFTRMAMIAKVANDLGAITLSLCTGTRDSENMWRAHPGNNEEPAWTDLIESMRLAVQIADEFDLTLAIEPEPANVVSNAGRAERLLAEINSDRLGIILDPANLIEGVAPDLIPDVLSDAITRLSARSTMTHGKDRDASGAVQAPGKGIVPWDYFLTELLTSGFNGPLVLHGFAEQDVPASVTYLKSLLEPID